MDAVLQIPVLENWNGRVGRVSMEGLQAPVSRGYNSSGELFLVFCYFKRESSGYYPYVDCLVRRPHGWEGPDVMRSELGGSVIGRSLFRSAEPNINRERILLDKVQRLMRGDAIGLLQDYQEQPPADAHLQGENFAELNLLYYEKRPPDGKTALFLYDPSKSVEENLQLFQVEFPN